MNLFEISEQLYLQLEDRLAEIRGTVKASIEKLSDSLYAITQPLDQLRRLISEHNFENEEAEISFFKNTYPKFYCWYIYITEEHNIVSAIPVAADQQVRDYYLQELAIVKRYFNQNQFSYQYFIRGETALDNNYFLRKNLDPLFPGFEFMAVDKTFATNQGYQSARFRAYEMLQDFIIKRIRLLYQPPETILLAELLTGKNRRWTGEKINLIEIAYGIYFTGQMNDGKADIKEIIAWLETSLQIDLSQAYRMFLDIRRRKTTSYTKFLESMCAAIAAHIEETYNYKPEKKNR